MVTNWREQAEKRIQAQQEVESAVNEAREKLHRHVKAITHLWHYTPKPRQRWGLIGTLLCPCCNTPIITQSLMSKHTTYELFYQYCPNAQCDWERGWTANDYGYGE